MPLYEYRCKNCNTTFQLLKSINRRDDMERCPKCGSIETERIISQFMSNIKSCSSHNYSGG
ncbi:FmdB family zinc ribbon protein [Thermodesulfovibrio thiophilus]|uniref:FmdB family zinc ribbon protein n=1 Tax=Thermodesulfovibrio thiophilus TaxID=340095 RepID=UPI00048AF48C|nr:zinc ribbon domain-containing protein [Thermodesulfovibrio thiophilus]